ncbi:MAG: sigma-54 interaction domain-containing protein [Myxococcales bacterium]
MTAIMAIQDVGDLRTLAERAAGGALRMIDGSASAAYIERPNGEPIFVSAGQFSGAEEQAVQAAAKRAAAEAEPSGVLAGRPGPLVIPFQAEPLRGAIVADRPAHAPGAGEIRLLADFARVVGVTAASIFHRDSSQLLQRTQSAIAEAISEGVLAVADGKVTLLNPAGAELLGATPAEAIGRPVRMFWPDLARALELGGSLDRQPMRFKRNALSVTSRTLTEGRSTISAAVSFVASPEPVHARQVESPPAASTFGGLIGVTPAIAHVREVARRAAQSSSSVLIEGESGVGKEVLAQAIHASGKRAKQPFVAVLCAAIPRELLESELFGYEAGSFTGANPRGRAGKFELAEGGTILLDDIVDTPLDMQAKLLRVLQERTVTRLGGSRARPINVRILATSNRTISEAVRAGTFRADLYYRLNVLKIDLPPLRERLEDVKPLAEHFLRKHAAAHGSSLRTIGAEALRALEAHAWPGNVRELEHWIESEIHFAPAGESCLQRLTRQLAATPPQPPPAIRTLAERERELYAEALAISEGDIKRTARDLGISRGKLYRKLRLYNLLPGADGELERPGGSRGA